MLRWSHATNCWPNRADAALLWTPSFFFVIKPTNWSARKPTQAQKHSHRVCNRGSVFMQLHPAPSYLATLHGRFATEQRRKIVYGIFGTKTITVSRFRVCTRFQIYNQISFQKGTKVLDSCRRRCIHHGRNGLCSPRRGRSSHPGVALQRWHTWEMSNNDRQLMSNISDVFPDYSSCLYVFGNSDHQAGSSGRKKVICLLQFCRVDGPKASSPVIRYGISEIYVGDVRIIFVDILSILQ